MMQLIMIGITGRPVIVDKCFNCHCSTAFISIYLEIPPVTLNTTPNPHDYSHTDMQLIQLEKIHSSRDLVRKALIEKVMTFDPNGLHRREER